ncbi:MAG: sulfatase-like hydrolase/transferase, partial [Flavobacteriales bacterium]|nr:sulfatase-like hydrolase/transferase [Flavobacteriales bacterium]
MPATFQHLQSLGKKVAIAFLLFTLCRISFVVFNAGHFNNITIGLFFYGIRFDMVSIAYLMAPLTFFELLPFPFRSTNGYQKLLKWLFYLPLIIGIGFNMVDLGYFQYTLKRTTFDFFDMVSAGDDFWKLLPNYIIDFWYAYVVFAVLIWFTVFSYKRFCPKIIESAQYSIKDYWRHALVFVFSLVLVVIGMRGGFQYRPIDMVNAGQYTQAQNTPVILNTPFTLLKTIFTVNLTPVEFYDEEKLASIYTPVTSIQNTLPFSKRNVVIFILESFSKEYIGYYNQGKGYTPFLDSLMDHSYVFTNAYANGQRSIESLPSILAGLPQLMNTPYSASNYAGNHLDALPFLLRKYGYNTSFYHGGANGTMGFNGLTGSIGVEHYFGMNEYPEQEKDYDGKWGIFDEPYLAYFGKDLGQKPTPFFSAVFTLSSHHPYPVPEAYQNTFPKGNLPIHETIGYTDYALRKFFKNYRQEPWFQNTLFVFTADHASQSESAYYKTNLNRFAVPAVIYDPTGELTGEQSDYFQQTDITPTLLNLLGIQETIVCFGNDAFGDKEKFVVNFISGNYQLASGNYFIMFDGQQTSGFYNVEKDSLLSDNLLSHLTAEESHEKERLEAKIKAIIQQYNNRMINNQ